MERAAQRYGIQPGTFVLDALLTGLHQREGGYALTDVSCNPAQILKRRQFGRIIRWVACSHCTACTVQARNPCWKGAPIITNLAHHRSQLVHGTHSHLVSNLAGLSGAGAKLEAARDCGALLGAAGFVAVLGGTAQGAL